MLTCGEVECDCDGNDDDNGDEVKGEEDAVGGMNVGF